MGSQQIIHLGTGTLSTTLMTSPKGKNRLKLPRVLWWPFSKKAKCFREAPPGWTLSQLGLIHFFTGLASFSQWLEPLQPFLVTAKSHHKEIGSNASVV